MANRFYRASYASAVLGVVILSVRPSVRPSHACFVTNPKTGDIFISERELTFTFAICYRPSVCLSVVCLSVTLVRPTQAVQILTSTENFTEIVRGEPLRRGS